MTTLDHRFPTVDVGTTCGSGHPPTPQPLVDPGRSPGLGAPSPRGRHDPGRRPLHLGAVVVRRHGQQLLRGRGQIGNGKLEGVSVRLPRPGNFITVDKPPASLWVMELSARIFGFSSWSMLLPEALAGVATVAVLYHLVRRWFGDVAALLAALAMALTPIAVVMFRDNNPDALLTLLLVLSRMGALVGPRVGSHLAVGALWGPPRASRSPPRCSRPSSSSRSSGSSTCGPGSPGSADGSSQLLWGGLALVVFSSWWVAIVELWPASSRPFIGSSTNNSELNLIFGYNGFGRLLGSGQRRLRRDRFARGRIPRHRGPSGLASHVQRHRRWTDLLAHAARPGRSRGRAVAHPTRLPPGSGPGRLRAVGRLDAPAPLRSSARPRASSTPTTPWPWLPQWPHARERAPSPSGAWDGSIVGSPSLSPWPSWAARSWAAALLGRTPGYAPGLARAILVAASIAALGILVALLLRPDASIGPMARGRHGGPRQPGSARRTARLLGDQHRAGHLGPLALAGPPVAGGGIDLGIPGFSISLASLQHQGSRHVPTEQLCSDTSRSIVTAPSICSRCRGRSPRRPTSSRPASR